MSDDLPPTLPPMLLARAAALLEELDRDDPGLDEAETRAAALGDAAGGAVRVDLMRTREPSGTRCHHDLLLRSARGTWSLSFAGPRDVPWPLLDAQRWDDRVLLSVDGDRLLVAEAMALLDFVWQEAPLARRLVDVCVVRRALREHRVRLDDAALEAAVDELRRRHGLLSSAATEAWLAAHGLTLYALEKLAAEPALLARLREQVVGAAADARFAADPGAFDRVRCAWIPVATAERADQLAARARDGAAMAALAEDEGALRFGALWRRDIPPGDGAIRVRRAPAAVIEVRDTVPAVLDAATRDALLEHEFQAWLADQRRAARVEWNWGPDLDT